MNPAASWALSSTVRACGRSPTVVSTIAFGSGSPAAAASSNHRPNCVIGELSSMSNVNVLSINEDLYMPADYRDRDVGR